MSYVLQTNKEDTLAAELAAGATTATLTSGSFDADTDAFLVIEPDVDAKLEVIRCTISGTAITNITRAQDGTTDVTHAKDAKVIMAFVPSHYSVLANAVANVEGADGWTSPAATHTYASGTTITVPAGALTKYSVGDKYKCTQSVPLTSYWNMDGNSTDTKGSNNGTDTNMSYTATGTKFTQHAVFGGTGFITITDAANLKPTGAFTLKFWVKTAVAGSDKIIFQSYSQNTAVAGIRIKVDTSNKIEFATGKNTGSTAGVDITAITSSATVTDGNWHYVVCTYQANFGKVFVDGVLSGSGFMVAPAYATTNYVRIGAYKYNASAESALFSGALDDMVFTNGFAVDAAWVAQKYAANTAQTNANITATQYFNVTTVADQLLTVTGGADYVLYNGTISSPYYSKAQSPVGFPQRMNFFPNRSAASGTLPTYTSGDINIFSVHGRKVTVTQYWGNASGGTAGVGAAAITFNLPITPSADNVQYIPSGNMLNNVTETKLTVKISNATQNTSFYNGQYSPVSCAAHDNAVRFLSAQYDYYI